MTKKELESLIAYHEKNVIHIENLASQEEVKEYRSDMIERVNRTYILLSEWKQKLAEGKWGEIK